MVGGCERLSVWAEQHLCPTKSNRGKAALPRRQHQAGGKISCVLIFGQCCGWSVGHSRAPPFLQTASAASVRFQVLSGSIGLSLCRRQSLAAGEGFRQPDELRHFADFFRKRFAGQFLSHLGFHGFGSFSLCRCRMFSKRLWSRSACWSNCSMRALSLARPTLAATATMCSARKTFAGTPS